MTIPAGDYNKFHIINHLALVGYSCIKDPNFLQAKQKTAFAIKAAIIGTIITIALAIFTSPIFPIITGFFTVALTVNWLSEAKKLKTSAQLTEGYLNDLVISKTARTEAGDTYDDNCLQDLFKVKEIDNTTISFYNLSTDPKGAVTLKRVRQDHNTKSWVLD